MLRSGLFDHDVVSAEEVAPRVVTEAGEQDGGVDDVGEGDRHRPFGVERPREIGLLALDSLFELVDRQCQRSAQDLDVGLRE